MISTVRGQARRRWRLLVLSVLLLSVSSIAALPWLLAMPAAQRQLAAAANKILAPGSVEFSEVRLSWLRPTEIFGGVLHDAQGDRVVAAARAKLSWSLWQILITRPKIATLRLEQSDVDIERFADGKIDLYETLKPVISERPPVRLVIRIDQGRLRFRDPAFTDPVVADKADISLDLGRHSEPITWNLQFERTSSTGEPARMAIDGTYSRAAVDPAGQHDLNLSFNGTRWPWTLAHEMVQARGELSGKITGQVRAGGVRIDGDATITNLVAIGDALSSDTVHLETARLQVGLDRNKGFWNIDKLDVASPIISIQGQGSVPPTPEKGAWLEAAVDLAAVAHQLPATLHLRDQLRVEHGSARLRADIRSGSERGTEIWSVDGKIAELAARLGDKSLKLSEPATLVAKIEHREKEFELERFDIQTSFLTATGQGNVDRGIVVNATLDLAAFRERFHDWIDFGEIQLAGQGKLEARYQRQGSAYRAGLNGAFRDLRLGGLPLVEELQREQLTLEAQIAGPATPTGWPESWKDLSLSGASGAANVTLSAQAGSVRDEFVVVGRASTSVNLADRPHRVEGELKAKSAHGEWTAERLALRVARTPKGGPGVAPNEAICWEGKGRYDRARDQLIVESLSGPPHAPNEHETWITGHQKLTASGLYALGQAQIEVVASADLASLGRLLSADEFPWEGQMNALVRARRDQELWNLGLRLELNEAAGAARDGSKFNVLESVVLTANAGYAPRSDRLDLSELTLKSPYIQVDGAGAVHDLTTRASVDLKGSLNPNWQAIQSLLAQKVEPHARISGRPRTWRLAGKTNGLPAIDNMGSLEGEIGIQIDSLDIFGMRLSAVPVVLRSAAGRLTVDPIDSKLNDGILHLEPASGSD